MPLNAEQRTARGRKAARQRWDGPEADVADEAAILEQAALDRHVNTLVESWHRATPEQKARLRRLFNAGAAG